MGGSQDLKLLPVPQGWEIVPEDDGFAVKHVIAKYPWRTACISLRNGATYGTKLFKPGEFLGTYPLREEHGMYGGNEAYSHRVLIRSSIGDVDNVAEVSH